LDIGHHGRGAIGTLMNLHRRFPDLPIDPRPVDRDWLMA
jgi:hypothetical protein